MAARRVKVIIDYDGTLTYEERYVNDLAKFALKDLAENILHTSVDRVVSLYNKTKNKILKNPEKYSWMVDGLPACYAHEGALLLNTVTTQTLIVDNPAFKKTVNKFFKKRGIVYDPVVDCANYLFHKHTHNLRPHFRERAKQVLTHFINNQGFETYILTCSLGDKVAKNLKTIGIGTNGFVDGFKLKVDVFEDTRQYEMQRSWHHQFKHPSLEKINQIDSQNGFSIDLRRPAYFKKLKEISKDGSRIIIAADMVSLPGILPMLMGMDFVLVKASYTPQWAVDFVRSWENGWVIDDIEELPDLVDKIMVNWFLKSPLI